MTAPKLEKARLQELVDIAGRSGPNGQPVVRPRDQGVEVQFNPANLRVARSSAIDTGGATVNTQHRQLVPSPAKLTVELEFDTTDGDASGVPVDVSTRTALVRKFVQSPANSKGAPPPRVCFMWGNLRFQGIMTQADEEHEFHGSQGVPLRAKVTVSITEQDLTLESGPAAKDSGGATQPGVSLSVGLGASGSLNPTVVVAAQAGESAQQLLARLNLDPENWRAAMNGLSGPLALAAGAQVELGAEVSASVGVGVTTGFTAGVQAGATAELAAALGPGADQSTAGFVLASGGGVAASVRAVQAQQAAEADRGARAAFGVPVAPPSPAVDPRALGYGRAIPLRARANADTTADIAAGGRRGLAARARPGEVQAAGGPAQAPWQQLPPTSAAADSAQRDRDRRPSTTRLRPGGQCR
ncbi:hypothetical protein GCM10010174_19470 [Kutzneria viridogrisea]|uniref:Contractile injection system tube protein N-terminal domain-containing protein n=2 Tax=Kutzneria TaxID=43356 RepID=W5WFE8_9PSEU|nr:hypothetical protein [Kutzneria albida]AHH99475.1 hypothetical protein KALB_6115 [Kutzneria albida DSM 43870]MBA8922967.1 hypothetical protein [Kutzneria viridogrisea]